MFYLILSVIALASTPLEIKDPIYDDYDGLALVEALQRDGKSEAALQLLESLKVRENAEGKRVKGEILFSLGRNVESISAFQQALRLSSSSARPAILAKLAKVQFAEKDIPGCEASARAAGNEMFSSEENVLLLARCEAKHPDKALAALHQGLKQWKSFALFQEKVRLFIQLKLFGVAYSEAESKVTEKISSSEVLSLVELFLAANRREEALRLLELARLLHPTDRDMALAIAPLYHQKGMARATVAAFELAARFSSSYAEHATELHRQLGNSQRSLQFQVQIPGEKEKTRQRIALAVEKNRWEQVSSLDSVVKRSGLQSDDEVSYALAFSLLRVGAVDRAQGYLSSIRTPSLMTKVAALRKVLDGCKADPAACRF